MIKIVNKIVVTLLTVLTGILHRQDIMELSTDRAIQIDPTHLKITIEGTTYTVNGSKLWATETVNKDIFEVLDKITYPLDKLKSTLAIMIKTQELMKTAHVINPSTGTLEKLFHEMESYIKLINEKVDSLIFEDPLQEFVEQEYMFSSLKSMDRKIKLKQKFITFTEINNKVPKEVAEFIDFVNRLNEACLERCQNFSSHFLMNYQQLWVPATVNDDMSADLVNKITFPLDKIKTPLEIVMKTRALIKTADHLELSEDVVKTFHDETETYIEAINKKIAGLLDEDPLLQNCVELSTDPFESFPLYQKTKLTQEFQDFISNPKHSDTYENGLLVEDVREFNDFVNSLVEACSARRTCLYNIMFPDLINYYKARHGRI